ncbi:hypothetical protein PHYSODRAFT_305076 [Phytophthora sojae]|uniref:EF-hand domain-containing protein n=1 Tax=Phytophthora sojae (strain P6497) TaxID=1094619 RepID=G5A4I9_PHYSP|nr:hypothetical protein PHYSODRAFT_305076 [Phytophthora sojae]EGZ09590.1 hypothetical protein PHYSODRAFT_305076 [Phytophthora sojae]|eukprot:XP_009534451.1 hypothetical protein PHYSODRAFT_305076 [Phytophthora sojae]
MAIRAACGVILASFIQLRDEAYDPAGAHTKKWRFFPDWYYLGGLSYCAVMVVFSMGINLGGTLREVCRGMGGWKRSIAAADPNGNYYEIHKAFNSEAYWINLPNLLRTLPWMILFTVVVLLLPFNVNTRKFALGSNAYYMLTIINPDNILRNLQAYLVVGVVGGFISVLTMLLPYPIMPHPTKCYGDILPSSAIQQLDACSMRVSHEIAGLLGLIVDSYCSKSHNVEQMNFLQLKINRKFNAIEARHRQMTSLLDDTWWEQCFGVHFVIPFNRTGTGNYINLVGSLSRRIFTCGSAASEGLCGFVPSVFPRPDLLCKAIHLVGYSEGYAGDDDWNISSGSCVGFSATVPSTIAYVMGNFLGGSFRVTVNRVGGVVAGSVVPSVFKFFFVQLCNPSFLNELLSEMVIFLWVSMSMYICFAGEYSSYAGLVSAFISADTLLRQTDLCYPNGSDSPGAIAISSYSSLAQTSVGVVIFIIVETFIFPQSAASLRSRNIQASVKLQQKAFDALFGYHLPSCIGMPADTLNEVRDILEVQIPRKLLKRKRLMGDAQADPVLWRGPFLRHKHERVLEVSHRMLNNIYLLFKLVCWFDSRVEQKRVALSSHDIRDNQVGPRTGEGTSTQTKWHVSTNHFLSSVRDRFDTIHKLYESAFWHSNPEQTAVFMQLKEAFRLADKNCTGELSADDVSGMLEKVFSRSVDVKEGEIQNYVAEFMAVVGKSHTPTISFQEFADAVENGLKLEVEVQHRRKSRTSSAGSDAMKSRLSSFRRSSGADGSKRWSADDKTSEARDAHRADEVVINIDVDNNTDSAKPKASPSMQEYIEGSISRRVVDRRGSVVVEEVSLTITPNLLHLDSDDEDDNSGLASDYTSTLLWRDHDAQNVEEFSIRDIAQRMKFADAEWLITDYQFEQVSMEEQFLLQCLVSGAEGVAKNLTELEEVTLSL